MSRNDAYSGAAALAYELQRLHAVDRL